MSDNHKLAERDLRAAHKMAIGLMDDEVGPSCSSLEDIMEHPAYPPALQAAATLIASNDLLQGLLGVNMAIQDAAGHL
ncbi:MAG: hypothetical protein ABJX32_06175 [Tateyamaria sp.]|uniref:hypothetical protein n=1 Tax=Tateyamaria sp. TaxID=1929288 RepID=UPI00329E26E0